MRGDMVGQGSRAVPGAAAALITVALSAAGAAGQDVPLGVPAGDSIATATLMDAQGAVKGRVILRQTPGNGVILDIRLEDVPAGVHALHIHETGTCSPDFGAAGGHYAPHGNAHGALHPEGMHGGDLLNLHIPADGDHRTERLAPRVSLDPDAAGTLFDHDGSALILHAGADDYLSQPSGDAGDRLLCGVIRR